MNFPKSFVFWTVSVIAVWTTQRPVDSSNIRLMTALEICDITLSHSP